MKMMKKVLAALLACLIVMSMAACAAKSDQTAKPDTAQTDADQPVPNAEDTQTPNAEAGDAPVSNDEADLTSWILEPDTNMAGAVRFWIPFKGEQGMDAMIAAFNEVYPNTRSFTVSSGSRTVRMEFGVFGVLITNFPSCRATLLLIESVRF